MKIQHNFPERRAFYAQRPFTWLRGEGHEPQPMFWDNLPYAPCSRCKRNQTLETYEELIEGLSDPICWECLNLEQHERELVEQALDTAYLEGRPFTFYYPHVDGMRDLNPSPMNWHKLFSADLVGCAMCGGQEHRSKARQWGPNDPGLLCEECYDGLVADNRDEYHPEPLEYDYAERTDNDDDDMEEA